MFDNTEGYLRGSSSNDYHIGIPEKKNIERSIFYGRTWFLLGVKTADVTFAGVIPMNL